MSCVEPSLQACSLSNDAVSFADGSYLIDLLQPLKTDQDIPPFHRHHDALSQLCDERHSFGVDFREMLTEAPALQSSTSCQSKLDFKEMFSDPLCSEAAASCLRAIDTPPAINYCDDLSWISFSDDRVRKEYGSESSADDSLDATMSSVSSEGSFGAEGSMSSDSPPTSPLQMVSTVQALFPHPDHVIDDQVSPCSRQETSREVHEDLEVSAFISECLLAGDSTDCAIVDQPESEVLEAEVVVMQSDFAESSCEQFPSIETMVDSRNPLTPDCPVAEMHPSSNSEAAETDFAAHFIKQEVIPVREEGHYFLGDLPSDQDTSVPSESFWSHPDGEGMWTLPRCPGEREPQGEYTDDFLRISQFRHQVEKLDHNVRTSIMESLYRLSARALSSHLEAFPSPLVPEATPSNRSREKRPKRAQDVPVPTFTSPNPSLIDDGSIQTCAADAAILRMLFVLPAAQSPCSAGPNASNFSVSTFNGMATSPSGYSSPYLDGMPAPESEVGRLPMLGLSPKPGEGAARRRVFFTSEQTRKLNLYYERLAPRGVKCSPDEFAEIARDVGITDHQVRIYFQNKRARSRNRKDDSTESSTKKRPWASTQNPPTGATPQPSSSSFPPSDQPPAGFTPAFAHSVKAELVLPSAYAAPPSAFPEPFVPTLCPVPVAS